MITFPFKKGEREKDPVSRVQELSSQGRSEKDIIRIMREEGYSNEDISQALNRAIKFKVTQSSQTYGAPLPPASPQVNEPSRFIAPPPEKPLSGTSDDNVIEMNEEEEIGLEELIEEIINEKWGSVKADLSEIQKGFVQLQDQIDFLSQRLDKIEKKGQEKDKEIKDMISESSSQMQRIEGRIGSVEKAFREFLPSLTENVRSLSEIVEKIKKKTKESKSKTKG